MKFSDILKKKGDAPEPQPQPAGPSSFPTPAAAPLPIPVAKEESDEALDQKVSAHALKATEVYEEAINTARRVYKEQQDPNKTSSYVPLHNSVTRITALLRAGNEELLALSDRATPDLYLYGHVVNVAILNIRLALAMGLSEEEIILLGLGGFLHDLGMIPYISLAQKAGPLTDSERATIQQHSDESRRRLALFTDMPPDLRERLLPVVGQVHERVNGQGYPEHRRAETMSRLAKIISLVDSYEAVTHVRAWRGRALPHEAIRLLIARHETEYDPTTVKALIESLSLYPPGSYVRLNNGEVGRVIFTNRDLPTRPRLKMILDPQGVRYSQIKMLNLATHPILYVAEPVDETRMACADQRLLLELRAQRWWAKGL